MKYQFLSTVISRQEYSFDCFKQFLNFGLKHGFNLEHRDYYGDTPYLLASRCDTHRADYLIDLGININAQNI